MINWVTSRMGLLIQTFAGWAEIIQARARSPTEEGAGGVLYLLIAVPVVLVAAYELVTIMTNLFRTRSNDRYPLMAHADGLMRAGKNPMLFHDMGLSNGFLGRMIRSKARQSRKRKGMTEDELLKAYIRARKKREKAEGEAEDKAFRKKHLNTAKYREMEELFKLHQQQFGAKPLKSQSQAASGTGGVMSWMVQRISGSGQPGSKGGSEVVPYREQESSVANPEPIEAEGHTVGEGEYIGPAAWNEGLKE